MLKNIFSVVVVLVLAALALAVAPARAQSRNAGNIERYCTDSKTVTSSALVCSAVGTKRLHIRGLELRSDTAGVVMFQDGATGNGVGGEGTTIACFYLQQNVSRSIDDHFFGSDAGPATSNGNALYVKGPGVLTYTVRVHAH